jgi:MFS family permease
MSFSDAIPWPRHADRVSKEVRERILDTAGGPARLQVIALLAAVLAMSGADMSTVGAVAPLLESAFHISFAAIGLLITASQLTGALAALPIGLFTDRVRRVRLLWISILLWAVAMVAAGLSPSYLWLLVARIGLGAVNATAGPTLVSLTGDFFAGRERGRIYGYILAGDLVGAGVGLLVAGNIAALLSWRWAFWFLAVPSLALAFAVHHFLPEPARGGQSHLRPGAHHIPSAEEAGPRGAARANTSERARGREAKLASAVKAAGAKPDPRLVLKQDPTRLGYWKAARYVLSVRTNLVLILASAIGYFFLAGVRAFAVIFFRGQYHLSESAATFLLAAVGLGALAGVLIGGRLADWLIGRRHASARLLVAAVCYTLTALLFAPAMAITTLLLAAPFYFLAAFALGGSNPPTDAARLDVMHFRLWGRAESIRTFARTLLEAAAPFVFGLLAEVLGGRTASAFTRSSGRSIGGLQDTFLLMLLPVVAAAALLFFQGRKHYPTDVATAIASEEATGKQPDVSAAR